jgi:hypothetical protein
MNWQRQGCSKGTARIKRKTLDDFDRDKVDEIVLALLQLTLHDYYRAWKGLIGKRLIGCMRKGGSRIREARQSRWYSPKQVLQNQLACFSTTLGCQANTV